MDPSATKHPLSSLTIQACLFAIVVGGYHLFGAYRAHNGDGALSALAEIFAGIAGIVGRTRAAQKIGSLFGSPPGSPPNAAAAVLAAGLFGAAVVSVATNGGAGFLAVLVLLAAATLAVGRFGRVLAGGLALAFALSACSSVGGSPTLSPSAEAKVSTTLSYADEAVRGAELALGIAEMVGSVPAADVATAHEVLGEASTALAVAHTANQVGSSGDTAERVAAALRLAAQVQAIVAAAKH